MGQLVQYNTATGVITGTQFNVAALPSQAQIDGLLAIGTSLSLQPDGAPIDGSKGSFLDGVYTPYVTPAQIPNIMAQLVAALINNGTVDASAFHPTTVTQLNVALDAASMKAVSVTATPSLGVATIAP